MAESTAPPIKGYTDPRTGEEGTVLLHDAIQDIRDAVTGLLMQGFAGHQRSLAMVLTKLDEAHLWALKYGEDTHAVIFVDRGPILRLVREGHAVDTSDATVTNGGSEA